jgi:hypothetical protein
MRDTKVIIADLEAYSPNNDNWLGLDSLLEELFQNPITTDGLNALFRIFERYSTHDGNGVFWSILHGIESVPDFEHFLLQSLRRRPSEFGVLMVNRILNAGIQDVDEVSWVSVLREVALRPDIAHEIRDMVNEYLQRHTARYP